MNAWSTFWRERNQRERSFLLAALAVCAGAALYALLIEPAVSARATLQRSLPELRRQVAQMQQLSQQAARLADVPALPPTAPTQEALQASLQRGGLQASAIAAADRGARLQFSSASFSALVAWLEQAQAQRLSITEASIEVLQDADSVKASITLTQPQEEPQ